ERQDNGRRRCHPQRRSGLRAPAGASRGHRGGRGCRADRRPVRRTRHPAASGAARARGSAAAFARHPGAQRGTGRLAARGGAAAFLPGRVAGRQALAGLDRPVRRPGRLLDAGDSGADRVGRVAVDLRRGQADDGDPQGPGLAPERVVAGADVGDQPPGEPRRHRVGEGRGAAGALALPHDGAAPRRRAALRRPLSAHAGAGCRWRAAHPAAARRPVQRPGAVRLRASDLGL
ncbi:MAG: hypothetical protein AVDCRST_MAG51-1574, partial [uncultured Ramlibacter sp.]